MGLSSAAAIAFSAMQAKDNSSPAIEMVDDSAANHPSRDDVIQADASEPPRHVIAELTEEEHAYRASAAAFETGADLWDILNVVSRD